MINFRFHLASLVAIFLALALGVVIGAGVIDRGVVDALDNRLDRVTERADRTESDNAALRTEIEEQTADNAALAPHAIGDRVANAAVGVLAVRGVDESRVSQTVELLEERDAEVTGVLWLESDWNLDDDEQIAALAEAIGSSSRRPAQLRSQAWQVIARRLVDPAPPGGSASDEDDDVLQRLVDAGFLGFDATGDDAVIEEFPGSAAVMALVVGSNGDVPADDVVMDVARAFAAVELPLVVGDVYDAAAPDAGSRGSDLEPLRDSDLSESVSTVDNLDRPFGPVTVALALADLVEVPPVVGHYGIGPDTVRLPVAATS